MKIDNIEFARISLLEYIAQCFESDEFEVEYNAGSLYILCDDGNTYFITVGLCEN